MPPLTEEELRRQRAIAAFLGGDGSGQVSDVENLSGSTGDLFTQFLLGAVDEQDLRDVVQEAYYKPYTPNEGSPILEMESNLDGINIMAEQLGLTDESITQVLQQIIGEGGNVDAAMAKLTVESDPVDPLRTDNYLDLMETFLRNFKESNEALGQFRRDLEDGTAVLLDTRSGLEVPPTPDVIDDQGNILNPNIVFKQKTDSATARAELRPLGLEGVFADPATYGFYADPDSEPSRRAERLGDELVQQQREIIGLQSMVGQPVETARVQDAGVRDALTRFIEDSSARDRGLEPLPRDRLETAPAEGIARQFQEANPYLQQFSSPPDTSPYGRASEVDRAVRDRQIEAANRAANRYATFAAAAEGGIPSSTAARQREMQGNVDSARIRENAIRMLQRQAEGDAIEQGVSGVQAATDNFLQTVVPQVTIPPNTGRRRMSLSQKDKKRIAGIIAGTAKL